VKARRKGTTRKIEQKGVDNIKTDLREVGCNDMDWIDLS
jgi:hypothetical protein